MALHSFDPAIAEKVGVNAAVIYQNIAFWVEKNRANNKHLHEGRYWTYNSMRAFEELFPYFTQKQIRTAIDKLIDCNLIVAGNFNKAGYDRTKWYSLQGQIELPSGANGIDQKGEPIPDSKPDGKQDISSSDDDGVDYYFDQLWEEYPRKVGKAQAKKAFKTASKKINFYDLLPKFEAYVLTLKGKEAQFIPHLATWLNGERWNDEGK